jgi:pimeloyl-ACP methyl ester carboxylesterase
VIHSYRHRFAYADGDPNLEATERRLAAKPKISVPTIVLHGDGSGLSPAESSLPHAKFFTGPYQRRVIPTAGHNLPQEVPKVFADAVLDLVRTTK